MVDPIDRPDIDRPGVDDRVRRDTDLRTDVRTGRPLDNRPGGGRSMMPWILGLLVVVALVIGGFFLFGGDVDTDTEGDFNVDVPSADVDIDGPDVSIETPDVDVDPGSVDVEGGDADADADTSTTGG